jgi:hypothetical protein
MDGPRSRRAAKTPVLVHAGALSLKLESPGKDLEERRFRPRSRIRELRCALQVVGENQVNRFEQGTADPRRSETSYSTNPKYLIDKDGCIAYSQAGEGAYDQFERLIQRVLKQANPKLDFSAARYNPHPILPTPAHCAGNRRLKQTWTFCVRTGSPTLTAMSS